MAFNKLTDAEAERLAILAEECAEVIQIIGKISRHGYESFHPADACKIDNRRLLEHELGDVLGMITAMAQKGDVRPDRIDMNADQRVLKFRKGTFLHHQS